MKTLIIIVGLSLSYFATASPFPGNEPDCWTQARAVHTTEETGGYIEKHISITRNNEAKPEPLDHLSPNQGYSFSIDHGHNDRSNSTISINAEKGHLTVISLQNIFGLTETKWVNENVLFFRTYLGQEVFIDTLFNAESEGIVWSQLGRYAKSAMQQYAQGCQLHGGCKCIQKQTGT